jgi:hypothetical protein
VHPSPGSEGSIELGSRKRGASKTPGPHSRRRGNHPQSRADERPLIPGLIEGVAHLLDRVADSGYQAEGPRGRGEDLTKGVSDQLKPGSESIDQPANEGSSRTPNRPPHLRYDGADLVPVLDDQRHGRLQRPRPGRRGWQSGLGLLP